MHRGIVPSLGNAAVRVKNLDIIVKNIKSLFEVCRMNYQQAFNIEHISQLFCFCSVVAMIVQIRKAPACIVSGGTVPSGACDARLRDVGHDAGEQGRRGKPAAAVATAVRLRCAVPEQEALH
jgi:hypothetical protein